MVEMKKQKKQFYIFWGVLLLFINLFGYEVCTLTADRIHYITSPANCLLSPNYFLLDAFIWSLSINALSLPQN